MITKTRNIVHIALGDSEFRSLVAGEIVELTAADGTTVRMLLSDVGFARMLTHVHDAVLREDLRQRVRINER